MATTEFVAAVDEFGVAHEKFPGVDDSLWNTDLAPAAPEARTWDWINIAALWVGMVVCVPTYLLAAGLVAEGMAWWQAVLTVSSATPSC